VNLFDLTNVSPLHPFIHLGGDKQCEYLSKVKLGKQNKTKQNKLRHIDNRRQRNDLTIQSSLFTAGGGGGYAWGRKLALGKQASEKYFLVFVELHKPILQHWTPKLGLCNSFKTTLPAL